MSISTHLITYEESLRMPESNLEEVIDGELHTMLPSTDRHNAVVEMIQAILARQKQDHFRVTWNTGFLIRQQPLLYRIPDLAVVSREEIHRDRLSRPKNDPFVRAVPLLVVEVLSPANRKEDLRRLLQDYNDLGVPEVLLFHPDIRTYESYRGLTLTHTAQTGSVSPRTMPEVSIDLDRLWEEFQ